MRNISATAKTLMTDSALLPYARVRLFKGLLSFSASSSSTVSQQADLPITLCLTGELSGYSTGSFTGQSYIRPMSIASSTEMGTGGYVESNGALISSTDGSYHYTANANFGGAIAIKKKQASNGTTVSSINLPTNGSNTASLIRRVESVQYTALGIVVAVGTHDIDNKLSTIKFYLVDSTFSSVVSLETIIQIPIPESYTGTYWYDKFNWCSRIFANSLGDRIVVVANTNEKGRPTVFTLRSGVESSLKNIMEMDADISDHSFTICGLGKLNSRLYLSGHMKRPKGDNTIDQLNMYLISTDGWNWSLGERSSILGSDGAALHIPTQPANAYVYAFGMLGGTGIVRSAPARNGIDNTSAPAELTSDMFGFIAGFSADQASSADIELSTASGVSAGDSLELEAGYVAENGVQHGAVLGRFIVHSVPTRDGSQDRTIAIPAVDEASFRLSDYGSPIDDDRWSQTREITDLQKGSGVVVQSTQSAATQFKDGTGLVQDGLNAPIVAFCQKDERDGMMFMEGTFSADMSNDALSLMGFVFGADNSGNFHAAMVPRTNNWAGHLRPAPVVKTSNFDPAGDKLGFAATDMPMLETSISGAYAKMFKATHATASPITYGSNWSATAGTKYQFLFRKDHKRVQVFARIKSSDPTTMAANSLFDLIYEMSFDEFVRMSFASRPYWGLIAGTDVWSKKDGISPGAYEDIEIGLSTGDIGPINATYSINNSISADSVSINDAFTTISNVNIHPTITLFVGLTVYAAMQGPTKIDYATVKITAISGNNASIALVGTTSLTPSASSGLTLKVMAVNSPPEGGKLGSGYSLISAGGTNVPFDPGATRTSDLMYGKACIVSNDSTAFFERYIATNGTDHWIYSRGANGHYYDDTNPIPGYGSTPSSWQMIFHQGRLFAGRPTTEGLLSDTCYFKRGDEIMRGAAEFVTYAGFPTTGAYWTNVPTYYFVVAKQSIASRLYIWNGVNGGNGAGYDIGTIPNPAGLYIEITNRSNYDATASQKLYAVAVYNEPTPSVSNTTPNDTDYITLNEDAKVLVSQGNPYELAVVSGRAQLGSDKSTHPSTEPLLYYPAPFPSAAALTDIVKITKFEQYNGLYVTSEDAIKTVCAQAGVLNVGFKSIGQLNGTLGTTAVVLSSSSQDFGLDFDGVLPTSTSDVLRIAFRSAYVLDVSTHSSTVEIAAGRLGHVTVVLSAPSSALTADSNGEKRLFAIRVPIAVPYLGDTSAKKLALRVIAKGQYIIVEVERRPIVTINLDDYKPFNYISTGPVSIQYLVGSYTVSARLIELFGEVENLPIEMGSQATSPLSSITADRHILARPYGSGGLYFSRFQVRDLYNDTFANVQPAESEVSPMSQPTHVSVSGSDWGEYIDANAIYNFGYSFRTGQNRLLNSVQDSRDEARALVRLASSQVKPLKIITVANVAIEPEDQLHIYYAPPGDLPGRNADVTLSQVSYRYGLEGNRISFESEILARE